MPAHTKEGPPRPAEPPDPTRAVIIVRAGCAAMAAAALHPRARIVIFAPTWRDVDETRALAARYGDRVTVHHQAARTPSRAA